MTGVQTCALPISPVWRAERPQKGRYRQFVQCDIDIIGEAGPLAEIELLTATTDTLRALGLTGCSIRINDRRLLTSMLTVLGFPATEHAAVLITIDKLDKLGSHGVVAELRDRAFPDGPVEALEAFLLQPSAPPQAFGADLIRASLPEGVDETAVTELASLGSSLADSSLLQFDPFLVRGMGYYTGTIFEVAHPEFGYSLGGGGRYDGMIGRFLGTEVPAAGMSLGFERLVDLVELPTDATASAVALVHDNADPAVLASLKSALIAQGLRVRLERKPRKLAALLDTLAASGFDRFAVVTAETATVDDLDLRPLTK